MIISLMTLLFLAAPLEASPELDQTSSNEGDHFRRSLALAGGKNFTKGTVTESVSSATHILDVMDTLLEYLPAGKEKTAQLNNISLVKEFFENYLKESGFNTAHSDSAPITWQPEKWTTITSSMNTTLTSLCTQVIAVITREIDGHKLRKAFSASRRENAELIRKNTLPNMNGLLRELKRPKNLSEYVKPANNFAVYTKKAFSILFPETLKIRRTQSEPAMPKQQAPTRPHKPLPATPHGIAPNKPLPPLPRSASAPRISGAH